MLEALGMSGALAGALELLREAREAWERLGRPLDAARCELLLGPAFERAATRQRRGVR